MKLLFCTVKNNFKLFISLTAADHFCLICFKPFRYHSPVRIMKRFWPLLIAVVIVVLILIWFSNFQSSAGHKWTSDSVRCDLIFTFS